MATRKKQKPTTQLAFASPLAGRFAIITSRFNEDVTRLMHEAAKATLVEHNVESISEHWVPGAWELPYAAQVLAQQNEFDGLIALGCVIRGETTHHEHIGRAATDGLMRVSLEFTIPIGFGLLTTDTLEQAMARAGGPHGNKGIDAALAVLELAKMERKDLSESIDDLRDMMEMLQSPR